MKILFRAHNVFIFVQTFQSTYQSFYNFRFSSRKSQGQQKLAKKIAHSRPQRFFFHVNSENIEFLHVNKM